MKLTILGSGTYQPELTRHSSAYLVETDSGAKICFDFGRSAIDQLLKLNIRITEIDAVFISHWHGDHVADIIALLHYTVAPLPDDISVFRPIRKNPLKIYGPKGTVENIKAILGMTRYGKTEFEDIEVQDLNEDTIEIDGVRIQSFPTEHTPAALCYRLQEDNKIFAYSGDSIETDGLRQVVADADLAVVEASWPESVKPTTHMTGGRAGKIASAANVKKLVATHVAPYYLRNFDVIKDIQEFYKGEVVLAEDLLEIEV